MRKYLGFTMIETIIAIILVGIVSAVAIPKLLSTSSMDGRALADMTTTALRVAQKAAITKHAYVCVVFGSNSILLTTGTTSACGTTTFAYQGKSSYASVPSSFYFDRSGRPSFGTTKKIDINGYGAPVCVATETGFVYQQPVGATAC